MITIRFVLFLFQQGHGLIGQIHQASGIVGGGWWTDSGPAKRGGGFFLVVVVVVVWTVLLFVTAAAIVIAFPQTLRRFGRGDPWTPNTIAPSHDRDRQIDPPVFAPP